MAYYQIERGFDVYYSLLFLNFILQLLNDISQQRIQIDRREGQFRRRQPAIGQQIAEQSVHIAARTDDSGGVFPAALS